MQPSHQGQKEVRPKIHPEMSGVQRDETKDRKLVGSCVESTVLDTNRKMSLKETKRRCGRKRQGKN